MTDYTKLVEALRYCAESGDFNCNKDCPMYPNYPKCLTKMDMDAAAAIEELEAEVDKWQDVAYQDSLEQMKMQERIWKLEALKEVRE